MIAATDFAGVFFDQLMQVYLRTNAREFILLLLWRTYTKIKQMLLTKVLLIRDHC
jgi:hypothetical protein